MDDGSCNQTFYALFFHLLILFPNQLHTKYTAILLKTALVSPLGFSDFMDLVTLLESNGLIQKGKQKAKNAREQRLLLYIQESEVLQGVASVKLLVDLLSPQ